MKTGSEPEWMVRLAASQVVCSNDRDAMVLGGVVRHWLEGMVRFRPEKVINHAIDLAMEHKLVISPSPTVDDVRRMARPFWGNLERLRT